MSFFHSLFTLCPQYNVFFAANLLCISPPCMKPTFSKFSPSLLTLTLNPIKTTTSHLVITQKSHSQLLKTGLVSARSSNLVQSYCKSHEFQLAHQLFDEISNWDLVSVTAIIGSFSRSNRHRDALSLFSRLPSLNLRPNEFTFGTTLRSSSCLADLNLGKQLHSMIIKMGLHSNVFVGSSLLDLYAKLSTVEEAQLAFDETIEPNVVSYTALLSGYLKNERFDDALRLSEEMPEKNVVSWNAMIAGFSQIGLSEEAVNLFVEMCREGTRPDDSSFPCVLTAAANIAVLGLGKCFHALAIKVLVKFDVYVNNALISLYSKCGSLEDSILVFEIMKERNIVSWNAMIWGYAYNGRGQDALQLFESMLHSGLKTNGVTILAVLFACNHAGLVDEGCKYFSWAREEKPSILRAEHYACMVDLLSRSGRFNKADLFIKELPLDPGIGFWKALLGGCQIHEMKKLSAVVASMILALDPKDTSSFIFMSNVYSCAEDWDRMSSVRREMKDRGMKRIPGCSWIEIKSKVHVFCNGDERHPQIKEIRSALESCLSSTSRKREANSDFGLRFCNKIFV